MAGRCAPNGGRVSQDRQQCRYRRPASCWGKPRVAICGGKSLVRHLQCRLEPSTAKSQDDICCLHVSDSLRLVETIGQGFFQERGVDLHRLARFLGSCAGRRLGGRVILWNGAAKPDRRLAAGHCRSVAGSET